MNTKGVVLFFAIAGCLVTGGQEVLELTDDDFTSRISDIETTLVVFYVPWCPDCDLVKPELEKASELLRVSNPQIAIAKMDCITGGKDICLEYSIDKYPTVKIFRMGQVGREYTGLMEGASITTFMNFHYGSPSRELFTLVDIEEFLKIQEAAVIGFFEKETELETFFLEYTDHFKGDYRFGHSSAVDVLSKYNESNSIVLFRAPQYHNKIEPNSVTFKGNSAGELRKFLKENYYGLVGHRTPENVADFQHPYVIAYYSIDYTNNAKRTNYWRNRILQVAKDYSGDFTFAISADDDFIDELNTYGHGYTGEKPIIAARDRDNRKFKMTAEFSIDNFKQFLSDLKEGNLEPYVKSQPIPNTNDDPVKVAVAKNFNEIVTNNGKDTLIEFHAPWCSYCQKLAPVFNELGTKMLDEDVEIIKFDGSANDIPLGFQVDSYPTLFWLPKDSKNIPSKITYKADFDLQKFITYISEHATKELKNYDRSGNLKKTEL